jgi:hypothetical protein
LPSWSAENPAAAADHGDPGAAAAGSTLRRYAPPAPPCPLVPAVPGEPPLPEPPRPEEPPAPGVWQVSEPAMLAQARPLLQVRIEAEPVPQQG